MLKFQNASTWVGIIVANLWMPYERVYISRLDFQIKWRGRAHG